MGKRFFAAFAILLLFAGCTAAPPSEPTAAATDPLPTVAEVPSEPAEAVPVETAAPTDAPRDTSALHSGLRSDGTFSAGTLFIGDSLTNGFVHAYLMTYGYLGDARYMAVNGAPLSRFFSSQVLGGDGNLYSPEFDNLSYSDAVARVGEEATAIYLMLGTNSCTKATTDKYIEVVDYLLDTCPNATVHLQLIPDSYSPMVDFETVNEQIRLACAHYEQQGIERVLVVETNIFIGQALGPDGVHLTGEGQDRWYTALVAHKKNNNLPE